MYLVETFLELSGLSWSNCVAVCSDVAALTGMKDGFTGRVKEVASHIIFQHCMIYREVLAAEKLQPVVNKVLQDVVSRMNCVKARALKCRLFKILCNEVGSDHDKH